MHEEPQIPNYGPPGRGPKLAPGMVFAIEPMITAGDYDVEGGDDGWAIYTRDGSLAAHCEHTVAVTENGPRVLTRRQAACRRRRASDTVLGRSGELLSPARRASFCPLGGTPLKVRPSVRPHVREVPRHPAPRPRARDLLQPPPQAAAG